MSATVDAVCVEATQAGGLGRPAPFDVWIVALEEDVIQGDYGYEPGEFTVYPDHWRPMWREGLTPGAAFKRACDALTEARKAGEAERLANWERIQEADRAAIAKAAGEAL